MKINPVYKRENMVNARSYRLAFIMLVFNGVLAVVALLSMYSVVARVKVTAEVRYSSFLELYTFVAIVEFIMLMLIIPAITAGSISGERERQTLELMLTTKMTPGEIVLGKLLSSFSTVSLLIVSSFPVLALVFVYGGVRITDVGMLLLCYMSTAFLVGCLGICFSAVFKRTTIATVVTYCLIIVLVVGTYAVNLLALSLSKVAVDSYILNITSIATQTNTGGLLYLLLLNPAVTFYVTINGQVGSDQVMNNITRWFGDRPANFVTENWNLCSIVLQLLLAGILLWLAIRKVNPKKK